MTLDEAIADIYRQVSAPAWAARNLDALADVLRDLSWLPAGPTTISAPALDERDAARLARVLATVQQETVSAARPVRVLGR
jgi:hypothetical protein